MKRQLARTVNAAAGDATTRDRVRSRSRAGRRPPGARRPRHPAGRIAPANRLPCPREATGPRRGAGCCGGCRCARRPSRPAPRRKACRNARRGVYTRRRGRTHGPARTTARVSHIAQRQPGCPIDARTHWHKCKKPACWRLPDESRGPDSSLATTHQSSNGDAWCLARQASDAAASRLSGLVTSRPRTALRPGPRGSRFSRSTCPEKRVC